MLTQYIYTFIFDFPTNLDDVLKMFKCDSDQMALVI